MHRFTAYYQGAEVTIYAATLAQAIAAARKLPGQFLGVSY